MSEQQVSSTRKGIDPAALAALQRHAQTMHEGLTAPPQGRAAKAEADAEQRAVLRTIAAKLGADTDVHGQRLLEIARRHRDRGNGQVEGDHAIVRPAEPQRWREVVFAPPGPAPAPDDHRFRWTHADTTGGPPGIGFRFVDDRFHVWGELNHTGDNNARHFLTARWNYTLERPRLLDSPWGDWISQPALYSHGFVYGFTFGQFIMSLGDTWAKLRIHWGHDVVQLSGAQAVSVGSNHETKICMNDENEAGWSNQPLTVPQGQRRLPKALFSLLDPNADVYAVVAVTLEFEVEGISAVQIGIPNYQNTYAEFRPFPSTPLPYDFINDRTLPE